MINKKETDTMRHIFIAAMLAAVFCSGALAKEPETRAMDMTLKAAAENLCTAGLNGNAAAVFDFLFHPAMLQQLAEFTGFATVQEFRDDMLSMLEEEIRQDPMESCRVEEAYNIECPSYAIGHFQTLELELQKCGSFSITAKLASEEEEDTETFTAGLVDGKWYVVIESMATGIDYNDPDTGENDMGLRDFAGDFCDALETGDPAAVRALGVAGISPVASSEHPDIMAWDDYLDRLKESWALNPEPVTCTVMSTRNYGQCPPDTAQVYDDAGMEVVTCGIIDLDVFMDKGSWYHGLSAVFIGGYWYIDPNDLIELSRLSEFEED